jgi:hypothetical protein
LESKSPTLAGDFEMGRFAWVISRQQLLKPSFDEIPLTIRKKIFLTNLLETEPEVEASGADSASATAEPKPSAARGQPRWRLSHGNLIIMSAHNRTHLIAA